MIQQGVYAIVIAGCGAWYSHSQDIEASVAWHMPRLKEGKHSCYNLQAVYEWVDPSSVSIYTNWPVYGGASKREALYQSLVTADYACFNKNAPYSVANVELPGLKGEFITAECLDDQSGVHLIRWNSTPYTLVRCQRNVTGKESRFIVNSNGFPFPA